MHRNTYLLVTALAVFAALVVGVNLGRKFSAPPTPTPEAVTTTAPTPTPTPTPHQVSYIDETCGFSLEYPSTLKKAADASGSAILSNQTDQIVITCQREIPRPPLVPERIGDLVLQSASTSATASARLYHDGSAKDGTPVDKLIFRNWRTGYDIFIAGLGPVFDALVRTVKLYP